jgi:hypothetical protein
VSWSDNIKEDQYRFVIERNLDSTGEDDLTEDEEYEMQKSLDKQAEDLANYGIEEVGLSN